MTTKVDHIGSKFGGDEPDTIEQLFEMLGREPLDPRFEKYGNFVYHCEDSDRIKVWGNFFTVSYGFDVETDDPELIERFLAAISANQSSEPYQAALVARKEQEYQSWVKRKQGRIW